LDEAFEPLMSLVPTVEEEPVDRNLLKEFDNAKNEPRMVPRKKTMSLGKYTRGIMYSRIPWGVCRDNLTIGMVG
jgi:hypothetical protein